MNEKDVEKFVEALNEARMTEEERGIHKAEKLGATLGKLIGGTVALLFLSATVWAILHYVFVLSVTWVQVLGAMVLFNIFKNLVLGPLLNK
jgi:hypothetical protein